jgi:hypothetical protein
MDHNAQRLIVEDGHPRTESTAGAACMWRRLEASLVYDSRQQSSSIGMRAVTATLPRLMYAARDFEIDLQIRPKSHAGRIRLLGQILDGEFEPSSGWVVVEGIRGRLKATLDTCGHFSIDGLTAGRHQLEVHLPHALIVIPAIHI